MLPILSTEDLTTLFGDCYSNRDISVEIPQGSMFAILGENGSGKSTFLKTIFGLVRRTSGRIFVKKREINWDSPLQAIANGVGMVQQHFCLVDTLSAIDNIVLGREPTKIGQLQRADAIKSLTSELKEVDFQVPWHTKVENLPLETRQKIEILKLIYQKSEILCLDEPTAVLSPQDIDSFYQFLKKLADSGKTVIVVTHRISEVTKYFDRFMVLREGRCVGTGEVKNFTESKILSLMIGRDLTKSSRTSFAKNKIRFEMKDVSSKVLKKMSLSIKKGEIHGIAGIEGNGQSDIVRTLLGLEKSSGEILLDENLINAFTTSERRDLGIAVIPGDRHAQAIWLGEPLDINFLIGYLDRFSPRGYIDFQKLRATAKAASAKLDVRFSSLDQSIGTVSGGNQQKFVFSRELAREKLKLLVCHHPTRGIDLGSINTIHSAIFELCKSGISVLYISSDLEELMGISDRISVINRGVISGSFEGPLFDAQKIGLAMVGDHHV